MRALELGEFTDTFRLRHRTCRGAIPVRTQPATEMECRDWAIRLPSKVEVLLRRSGFVKTSSRRPLGVAHRVLDDVAGIAMVAKLPT